MASASVSRVQLPDLTKTIGSGQMVKNSQDLEDPESRHELPKPFHSLVRFFFTEAV